MLLLVGVGDAQRMLCTVLSALRHSCSEPRVGVAATRLAVATARRCSCCSSLFLLDSTSLLFEFASAGARWQEAEKADDQGVLESNANHPFHTHGIHGVPSKAYIKWFDAAQDVMSHTSFNIRDV